MALAEPVLVAMGRRPGNPAAVVGEDEDWASRSVGEGLWEGDRRTHGREIPGIGALGAWEDHDRYHGRWTVGTGWEKVPRSRAVVGNVNAHRPSSFRFTRRTTSSVLASRNTLLDIGTDHETCWRVRGSSDPR